MSNFLPYFAVIFMGVSSFAFSLEEMPECPEGQIFDTDLEECVEIIEEELQIDEGS